MAQNTAMTGTMTRGNVSFTAVLTRKGESPGTVRQSTEMSVSDTLAVASKTANRVLRPAGQARGNVEAMAICCKWEKSTLFRATYGLVAAPALRMVV